MLGRWRRTGNGSFSSGSVEKNREPGSSPAEEGTEAGDAEGLRNQVTPDGERVRSKIPKVSISLPPAWNGSPPRFQPQTDDGVIALARMGTLSSRGKLSEDAWTMRLVSMI